MPRSIEEETDIIMELVGDTEVTVCNLLRRTRNYLPLKDTVATSVKKEWENLAKRFIRIME